MKKQTGFTLLELMIVVVVIGIIAAIAYPSYGYAIIKARRADAMGDLVGLQSAIERFYTENNTYVGVVVANNNTATVPYPANDGTAFYTFSVSGVAATTFTLLASPTGGQAGDGKITLNQADVRGWDKDNSGTISSAEQTWE